jgi:hypothetical protein
LPSPQVGFASRLPGNRFRHLPDQSFLARRSFLSCPGPDARDGLSLAHNDHRFRGAILGSTFLAYHFASQPAGYPARSAFLLRYQNRFAPISAASTLLARCNFPDSPDWPLLQPPLPFGIFTSLRIEVFNWARCLSVRLPNPPDFLSLPAAGFYH